MPDEEAFRVAMRKLSELMTQFKTFEEIRAKISEAEEKLNEDWRAWYHIYEKEKPPEEQAELALEEDTPPVAPLPDPTPLIPGFADGVPPVSSDPVTVAEFREKFTKRTYGQKTQKVMEVLRAVGNTGITPKGLTEALRALDIAVSDGFASNALFRLRKNGVIHLEADGRYVLSSLLPREGTTER
jgi:DNA-binding transcriptional ArsR family regulator